MKPPTPLEELDEVIDRVRKVYPCTFTSAPDSEHACDSEESGLFSKPDVEEMCHHCRAYFYLLSGFDDLVQHGEPT